MEEPTTPANPDEDRRRRTQEARATYDKARDKVRDARTSAGGTPSYYEYFVQDVSAAAVELMLSGLDEWLAAGAKDRASAELDRKDQQKARWVMIALTVAIVIVGVLGYLKPAPAPIVNNAAPVVNVPTPVVNVTVPAAASPVPPSAPSGTPRRKRSLPVPSDAPTPHPVGR